MKALVAIAKEKPVELIASTVMVLAGLGMVLASSGNVWLSSLGSVLSTVGGVLLSWSAASISTIPKAAEILRPQIDLLSQSLGTVSGQIRQSVTSVRAKELDERAGLAQVYQSTTILFNIVTGLQTLTGRQFDSAQLLSTVHTLEEMADNLSAYARDETPTDTGQFVASLQRQMADELAILKTQLQAAAVQGAQPHRLTPEKIACPYCNAITDYRLGSTPGDSAMPACPKCGRRFHAHRGPDGKTFTRVAYSTQIQPRMTDIACPKCGVHQSIVAWRNDEFPAMRYCIPCGRGLSRLFLNTSSGEISGTEDAVAIVATVVGEDGGRSLLKCPKDSCAAVSRAFIRREEKVYADSPCGALLEADVSSQLFAPKTAEADSEGRPGEEVG